MGTFVIKPKNLSNITCSMMETASSSFQIVPSSIDMNETARLEVLYTKAEIGGSVRKSKRGLVKIRFGMVVFGTTQANAMSNFRTLVRAITNREGGHIQYKPIGLAGGVLDTYYHYLQGAPPKIVRRGALHETKMESYGQPGRDDSQVGILCAIELMTEAWATSDPDTFVEIVSATTVDNGDDGSRDNSIIVDSDDIKGDALFPVIKIKRASAEYSVERALVYAKEMDVSDNSNLDVIEGEDFADQSGWFTVSTGGKTADASGASYVRTNTGGTAYLVFNMPTTIDRTYLGKVSIIVGAFADAGDVWEFRLATGSYDQGIEFTRWVTIDGDTIDEPWQLMYSFKELSFPAFLVQQRVADADIGDYLDNSSIILYARRVSGSGFGYVDFIVVARSEPWIGVAHRESYPTLIANRRLEIDAATAGAFVISESAPESLIMPWNLDGSSLHNLIMLKGKDYRLRSFLADYENNFDIDMQQTLSVTGIFGTIYPFEET